MKKEPKKALAILLSLVLITALLPLEVWGYSEEELTASTGPTFIENEVFSGTLRIFGGFSDNGIPSLVFKNCSFENIEAVAGGDWNLIFEGENRISGRLTVVNESEDDLRETNDMLFIINPPTGTVIAGEDTRISVILRQDAAHCTFNEVLLQKTDAMKELYAAQSFDRIEVGLIPALFVKNAKSIAVFDSCPFGNIRTELEEEDVELALHLTPSYHFPLLAVSATPALRCSCTGEEPCDCACCSGIGCSGSTCLFDCQTPENNSAECACNQSFTPGRFRVTGQVDGIPLLLAGMADISALSANAGISVETWFAKTEINIGSNSIQVLGNVAGTADFTAEEGAYIYLENPAGQCISVNKEFLIGQPRLINAGDVVIDTNDDSIFYALSLDETPIDFEKDLLTDPDKTRLLVRDAPTPAIYYDFEATREGTTIAARIYHESLLVASPDNIVYEGKHFTGDVDIFCMGDYDEDCRIEFNRCTFDGNIKLHFIGCRTEVRFGEENTIAGNMQIVGDNDYRFIDREATIWNLPAGTPVTTDKVRVSIYGENNEIITLNNAAVTPEEGENIQFGVHLNYACRGEHTEDWDSYDHTQCEAPSQGASLYLDGNIDSFEIPENCEISEISIGNVFSDISGLVSKMTGEGELFLRVDKVRNDNPQDTNIYKTDPELILSGGCENHSIELVGHIDISNFGFIGDEDHEIRIGTWEENTSVNIANRTVRICGGGEYPVAIRATAGAYIRLENSSAQLSVNNGEINIQQPHIFGDEDHYSIYIGNNDREITYKLFCGDNELPLQYSYFDEENKLHLTPTEPNNEIGNWRLLVTKNGITVELQLAHKEWMCPGHEFGDWQIEKAATCTDTGIAYRICSHCEQRENALILPSHIFTAKSVADEYLQTAADCNNAAVYYTSCSVCGLSGKGTAYECTFVYGTARGHSPATAVQENVTAATCSAAGAYDSVVYCSVCLTEISRARVPIPVLAHSPAAAVQENVTAATCSAAGAYDSVVYCSVCLTEISRTRVPIPVLAHSPGSAVRENNTEPTFDANGSFDSVVYCTDCHTVINKTTVTVPALRHTSADVPEQRNVIPATCTTPGSYDEVYCCRFCGIVMSSTPQSIPCTAHTPGTPTEENTVPATCAAVGSCDSVVHCTVCSTELSRTPTEIPKTNNHTFGEWAQTIAPTTLTDGEEARSCFVCEKRETRSIPKLTGLIITPTDRIVVAANGFVFALPAVTVAALLDTVTPGAVVLDAEGAPVADNRAVGTGMRIALLDGNEVLIEKTIIVQGDIDGDSSISAADARLALRISVQLDSPTPEQTLAGLLNGTAAISAAEARSILRASVGLDNPAVWFTAIVT